MLAKEVITFVHSKEDYEKAVKEAEALFNGDIKSLTADELINDFKEVSHFDVVIGEGILDMLVRSGSCQSKREAREMLLGNAISINGEKVSDVQKTIASSDLIEGKVLLLKKGKKNYFLGTI